MDAHPADLHHLPSQLPAAGSTTGSAWVLPVRTPLDAWARRLLLQTTRGVRGFMLVAPAGVALLPAVPHVSPLLRYSCTAHR
jgi:hypothetical protein